MAGGFFSSAAMAVLLFCFSLIPPFSSSTSVKEACIATRYPQLCESSLTQLPSLPENPTPLQIIQSELSLSFQNLKSARAMVEKILETSKTEQNLTTSLLGCVEGLGNTDYRSNATADALSHGGAAVKDARTWLSAGSSYQIGCWTGLSNYVNESRVVNDTVSFMENLVGLTSNALSMMAAYDMYGNETGSWGPPKTERDGFWEVAGGSLAGGGFGSLGIPEGLTAEVTVCKGGGGGCDFETVQAAVDAAPGTRRFVIGIKEGVYEETVRVPLDKKYVTFLGDGMGKTVITGSLNVGILGIPTTNTSTVGVLGDGFMASGLTIQNTAGPGANQAVAFKCSSDLSIMENCEFIGNQDTLYAHSFRQFYKSCLIIGNIDFIFGNSAAIFQDCTILVQPRQANPEAGDKNMVTAHGRTDPAQTTGFVFQNCLVNGTDKYMALYHSNPKKHLTYLGRPWKEYARTVFIQSTLGELISPQGWAPWSGDIGLTTLYYGEFNNSGPGANLSERVPWSSQIPAEHVNTYSVKNFIQETKETSEDKAPASGETKVPTSDASSLSTKGLMTSKLLEYLVVGATATWLTFYRGRICSLLTL